LESKPTPYHFGDLAGQRLFDYPTRTDLSSIEFSWLAYCFANRCEI